MTEHAPDPNDCETDGHGNMFITKSATIVTEQPVLSENGFAMSEQIGDLASALAKAQGKITGALKSLEGQIQNRKYAYADLAGVYEACRDQLCEAEIAVVQFVHGGHNNASVTVTTMLVRDEQWMRSSLTLFPTISTPQGIGSAITYARRYSLAAMVGVAPEDDDGRAASAPAAREDDGQRRTPQAPDQESPKQVLFRKIQHWSRCQPEDVASTARLVFAHPDCDFADTKRLSKPQVDKALVLVERMLEQRVPFLDVFPPKEQSDAEKTALFKPSKAPHRSAKPDKMTLEDQRLQQLILPVIGLGLNDLEARGAVLAWMGNHGFTKMELVEDNVFEKLRNDSVPLSIDQWFDLIPKERRQHE